MIGGEAANRILQEVTQGIETSSSDTPEQAEYRASIVASLNSIAEQGGIVEMPSKVW